MNDLPINDFDGLTPNEMHQLLYGPFTSASPLRFSMDGIRQEELGDAPLFLLVRYFLEELRAQEPMKLTQKGYLPVKLILKLWDAGIMPQYHMESFSDWKPRQEMDWIYSHLAHVLPKMAGLIKVRNNKLSLTKKGTAALADPVLLYALILQTFAQDYNWAYLTYDPEQIAQLGFGYSIYLFLKYGREERPSSFYALKYQQAFPTMLHQYAEEKVQTMFSVEDLFRRCYSDRTFQRFLKNFGLAALRFEGEDYIKREMMVSSTPLLFKVFHFQRQNPYFAEN